MLTKEQADDIRETIRTVRQAIDDLEERFYRALGPSQSGRETVGDLIGKVRNKAISPEPGKQPESPRKEEAH